VITQREAGVTHRDGADKGTAVKNTLHLDIFGRPYATFRGAAPDDDSGGGAGDAGGAGDDAGAGDSDDDGPDKDGLTSGGRRALEQEREAVRTAKRQLAPWRKIERDFHMSPDEVRAALEGKVSDGKGGTTDVEQIRREAESEATKRVNLRLVKAEVRASATAKFADPEDAHLYVDLDDIDVDKNGEVDTASIERALADVLRRKPHLAKKAADEDRDMDDLDGGARRAAAKPKNMSDVIRAGVAAKRGGSLRL
jgi:hypothetical protein